MQTLYMDILVDIRRRNITQVEKKSHCEELNPQFLSKKYVKKI